MITDVGRNLQVVSKGKTLQEARNVAYAGIEQIHFEGIRCRTDIVKK